MPVPIVPVLVLLGTLFGAAARKRLTKKKLAPAAAIMNEAPWRQRVLAAARAELGKDDPNPYAVEALGYRPTEDYEWCGLFALAILHWAGLAKDWLWELEKGFLYRLPTTTTPQPGDLFYIDAENHHGIVEEVQPDGRIVTLNGNSTDGKVARVVRDPSEIRAFYSITPLISKAST